MFLSITMLNHEHIIWNMGGDFLFFLDDLEQQWELTTIFAMRHSWERPTTNPNQKSPAPSWSSETITSLHWGWILYCDTCLLIWDSCIPQDSYNLNLDREAHIIVFFPWYSWWHFPWGADWRRLCLLNWNKHGHTQSLQSSRHASPLPPFCPLFLLLLTQSSSQGERHWSE